MPDKDFDIQIDGLKEVQALFRNLPKEISDRVTLDLNMRAARIVAQGLADDAPDGNNTKKHKQKIAANTTVTKGKAPLSAWAGFKRKVFYVLFTNLGTKTRRLLGRGKYKKGNRGAITGTHWVERSHERSAEKAVRYLQDNYLKIINQSIKKQLKRVTSK